MSNCGPLGQTAVVVVHYGGIQDTIDCLRSLLGSNAEYVIAVIDNGPHDADIKLAAELDSRIVVLSPDKNEGFAAGCNIGIRWLLKSSNCDSILLLNNDATVRPETIETLRSAMEQDQDIGLTVPKVVVKGNTEILWYGGAELKWYVGGAVIPGVNGPSDSKLANEERDVAFASFCAVLIRASVIREIGYLDERFFMYEEDVNYCQRVIGAGLRIHYVPRAVVEHKRQGSTSEDGEQYVPPLRPKNPNFDFFLKYIVRNRLFNILQTRTGVDRLIFLFGWLLWVVKLALRIITSGRLRSLAVLGEAICDGFLMQWNSE